MKAKILLIDFPILLLVLLFTYTVWIKVFEYEKFLFQLGHSPLPVIAFFAPVLAFMVPIFSAVIVVLLLLPGWGRTGLKAAFILLLLFELYIVVVFVLELPLPCQCSGLDNELSWHGHLYLNAGFMCVAGLALWAVYGVRRRRAKSNIEYIGRHEARRRL